MDIAVEMSLYPLDADYIPPIKDFIDRLNADGRLKVVTNSLSTQVFGPYEVVFAALTREMNVTFAKNDKSVFVMKARGPLPAIGVTSEAHWMGSGAGWWRRHPPKPCRLRWGSPMQCWLSARTAG